MKNIITTIALSIVAVFVFSNSAQAEPAKILIVHSYESRHVCGFPQEIGVRKALLDSGFIEREDITIRRFLMDTKKTYTTKEQIAERGRLALKEVERFKPSVVVTVDDNAFKTVALPLLDRKDISVVFTGMNAQPEKYNRMKRFFRTWKSPEHNITGVYEKLHIVKALTVMKDINPSLKKIVAITDYTPTGNAITKQFEIELENNDTGVEVDIKRARNLEEYIALLKRINKDPDVGAIYPAALSLKSLKDGKTYTKGIFKKTLETSKKPEIALNFFFSKLGYFGTASVDFERMGYQAGEKVAAILKGKNAGDIPMESAKKYAIVFNRARAKMLGIKVPFDILTSADDVFDSIPLLEKK